MDLEESCQWGAVACHTWLAKRTLGNLKSIEPQEKRDINFTLPSSCNFPHSIFNNNISLFLELGSYSMATEDIRSEGFGVSPVWLFTNHMTLVGSL